MVFKTNYRLMQVIKLPFVFKNFVLSVFEWLFYTGFTVNAIGQRTRLFRKKGPCSAVGNVSGNRCESDCRSRGRQFDPCPVLHFRGDRSWTYFYSHSPPFCWIIQEGLLSVAHKVLVNCVFKLALAQEQSVVRWTDRPIMTIAIGSAVAQW